MDLFTDWPVEFWAGLGLGLLLGVCIGLCLAWMEKRNARIHHRYHRRSDFWCDDGTEAEELWNG